MPTMIDRNDNTPKTLKDVFSDNMEGPSPEGKLDCLLGPTLVYRGVVDQSG